MSFTPSQAPPKSRAPWILTGVLLIVVIIGGVVFFIRSGDEGDGTATATTVGVSSATTLSGLTDTIGPETTDLRPDGTLGPVTNGGPPVVTAPVKATGTKLPPFPDAGPDPARDAVFPQFIGSNVLDGSPLEITFDGRAKVLIFIAHWCPHCQREVPLLTRWINQNGLPPDVDLYGVSTGADAAQPNFPPAEWLLKENWPVPTMADNDNNLVFKALGLSSFPSYVVVDASGRVVERATGELSVPQFESLVAAAQR